MENPFNYLQIVLSVAVLAGVCADAAEVGAGRNPSVRNKLTPAAQFGGRYSLHEYAFKGTGAPHAEAAIKKYDMLRGTGSDIDCRWSVAWPEAGAGLSEAGLAKVRAAMLDDCFVDLDPDSDDDEDGKKAKQKAPPKTIEGEEAKFRRNAAMLFLCRGATNDTGHCCSQWQFIAECTLSWPFGVKAGKAWYERPVICYKNEGYSNDGGNGCHSYVGARVFSLPDGKELNELDYFRKDAMKPLFDLVLARLLRDNKLTVEDTLEKDLSKVQFGPGELCINVSAKGMTWWVSAYHVFPGCCGVTHVTIPWSDLEKFKK